MADNSHVLDNDYDHGPNVYEDSFQSFIVSRRCEAVEAARMYTTSFGTGLYQPPFENQSPINERECLGHKETIYGVNFSDCGTYLATASQDATVRVWDVASNSLLSTLTGHSKDYECLRTAW
jgi:WD40 repeat protein